MKTQLNYAGFWRRTSASLLDMIITLPILISLVHIFGLDKHSLIQLDENIYSVLDNKKSLWIERVVDILSFVIFSIYSVFFVSSKRKATIGKIAFGIYVTDINGNKISKMRALARLLVSVPSVLTGVGVLMIAFTKEKTALHDMICSTRVIKKDNKDE